MQRTATARASARSELSDFLASRRARLKPEDVGLANGGRRRVPGLRREEVAVLANVSETWYARLEQGKEIGVSGSVLEAVARALHLDPHERAYLFVLAGRPDADGSAPAATPLPALVAATLAALPYAPAVVYDPRFDVLSCNRAYVAVFGDITRVTVARGNVVRQMFLDPTRRTLFPEWESVARSLLQNFRLNAGRNVGDPRFADLIASLRFESSEFSAWWDRHDVERRPMGEKLVDHPLVGRVVLDHLGFTLAERPEILTIVYTARPESESEQKLRRLLPQSW